MDLTPECAIVVAGVDITERLRAALVELRVESTTDRTTDTVEITLAADGGVAAPPLGRELRVSIGYRESGLVDLGSYWHTETEIECAPRSRTVVRATGADLRESSAVKTPRTRAWHDTTLRQILEDIAAEHGLALRIDAALAPVPIAHEDQTDESDMHLIRRLAVRYGGSAKLIGPYLVFAAAGTARSATGGAMPSVDLSPQSSVVDLRATYRERPKVASVRARYWSVGAAASQHATAGSGAPVLDLPDQYPDQQTAAAAARSALARHRRAGARLEATIPGDPTLSAGASIHTTGWPIRTANGTWIAERVTHTLATHYTTTLTATAA